jgi:saccharopine dehydrogenase-like NADP-dependent oxidoreductase
MPHIHWVGTGLSAIPGIRRLAERNHPLTVWNRTVAKARDELGDVVSDIRAFDMDSLADALASGDVVISMLPGDWHVPLAELCLSKSANFVSSSYIAPEMRALDGAFKEAGLACVNEVGLDPGIDHSMAHWLVEDLRSHGLDGAEVHFTSYCGGVPKVANPFRYKFSWSPLGVLKALKSPSVSIKMGEEWHVSKPWDAISSYTAPLPTSESFEVYPNRDSLPFMEQYHFDPNWQVGQFVRGTLRLNGWADAWADVFSEIDGLEFPQGDARLEEMSNQFWAENSYDEGELDRVILCVGLKAVVDGMDRYNKTYVMDAWGDENGTAMARLVSIPVSLAVEAVLAGEIPSGVSAAPGDAILVDRWMLTVAGLAQHLEVVDHLA